MGGDVDPGLRRRRGRLRASGGRTGPWASSRRPTMPQSSRATVPSARTSTLPAWMSPWNAPLARVVTNHVRRQARTSGAGSMPRAAMPTSSSMGTPSRRSWSAPAGRCGYGTGSGTRTSGAPTVSRISTNQQAASASLRRSSSSRQLRSKPVDEAAEGPGDADGDLAGDEAAERAEHGEVGGHAILDAGPEHLDRDRRAVGQLGAVHDGERRRRRRAGGRTTRTPR